MPYEVVCVYKDNEISPLVYPSIIKKIGEYYNQSYALIEINDNGQQIVDSLFDDYEYENILSTVQVRNKVLVTGGYGRNIQRGIRTTKSVKRLGCSILKNLIEAAKLHITDFDIISELSTFVSKGSSFEAEDGSHDDLVMCLVLFAWLSNQEFFKDLSNINLRSKLYADQMNAIEEESLPLPIILDDVAEMQRMRMGGDLWTVVERDESDKYGF
jgi:hypothetical protein